MRITFFITFIVLLFSSCSVYKDIEVEEVRDIRITNISEKGIEAEVDVKVFNPNGYKVSIVSIDADLYVNDKDVGDAKLRRKVTLGKKSNEVHTIKIDGDYTDMSGVLLQTLLGGLFSQTMNLKIDGTMKGKALLISKDFYFKVDEDVRLN